VLPHNLPLHRRSLALRVLARWWLHGVLCLLFVVVLAPGAAAAAEGAAGLALGKWAFKRLDRAHDLFRRSRYTQALEVMASMKRRRRLNDHERAMMWQTYGYIWSAKNHPRRAIDSFERCLALGALPEAAALDTQFNLGQLYLATRRFDRAASTLASWLSRVRNPSPEARFMLALAYTRNKQPRKGLYHAQQACAGRARPPRDWLLLRLALNLELNHRWQAAHLLEQLLRRSPRKRTYWIQLASLYTVLKKDRRALAVLELAHRRGLLTRHEELLNLAARYLGQGIPLKAARVIQRGLSRGVIRRDARTLRLLGDSWLQAREISRSIQPLSTAARMARDGELYLRLAQIHIRRRRWQRARRALNSARRLAQARSRGRAHLLLGIVSYNLGQAAGARLSFKRALAHPRTRAAAARWLQVLRTGG
jgi:predicted Zn-dependent protease